LNIAWTKFLHTRNHVILQSVVNEKRTETKKTLAGINHRNIGSDVAGRTEVHPLPSVTFLTSQFLAGKTDGKPVIFTGELRIPPAKPGNKFPSWHWSTDHPESASYRSRGSRFEFDRVASVYAAMDRFNE
jgi:hypothetical protein